MSRAYLIYPHQLFVSILNTRSGCDVVLVEEPLFFTQYNFHKKKLIFHRAAMKAFGERLIEKGFNLHYIESRDIKTTEDIALILQKKNIHEVDLFDVVDDWLEHKLEVSCKKQGIKINKKNSPNFYLSAQDIKAEFKADHKFSMASFYAKQRKRFHILMEDNKPLGGKWSFDTENRKKIPRGLEIPARPKLNDNPYVIEAKAYVEKNFPNNYGSSDSFEYPVTHDDARKWLDLFLEERIAFFGPYQDAILTHNSTLFHSILSPLINIGLLNPSEVIETTLSYAENHEVPLNCIEGFVRQILGWREFVRGVYCTIGRKERTKNFFGHTRELPSSFWKGTTGIFPIDNIIQKVLKTAYAHHIERLMVMANFMLLCEFKPDDIYRWFMELFIDAYDWVMVPNIYGMGLYADGGMITTKPYISGSNYLLKMSDFPKGEWTELWNSLYWNFVDKHKTLFAANPRCQPIVLLLNKMDPVILRSHKTRAQAFLATLEAEALS